MAEATIFGSNVPGSVVVVHTPYNGVVTGTVQYGGDVKVD